MITQKIKQNNLMDNSMKIHYNRLLFVSIVCLVFSAFLIFWLIPNYVESFDFGDGDISPRFFPYLMTAIFSVLSLVVFIRTALGKMDDISPDINKVRKNNVIIGVLLLYLYLILIFFIGMLPGSIITIAAFMWMFSLRKGWVIVVFSLVFSLALFLFFEHVANVPMPRGMFEGY